MLLRLALREILGHKSWSLAIFFNLTLGIVGYLSIESSKDSLLMALAANSRESSGADFLVSVRRPFTPVEELRFEGLKTSAQARLIEQMVMAAADSGASRLVQLRYVSQTYPLYGRVVLSQNEFASLHQEEPQFFVYPELLVQLGLKVGDFVQIGALRARIGATVVKDSANALSVGFFAPRVYVSDRFKSRIGLIQPGSTVTFTQLLASDSETLLQSDLESIFTDSTIRIQTHLKASEQNLRSLLYLGDYLGLAALIALSLASLGLVFLISAYMKAKTKDMAILLALGMPSQNIIAVQALELAIYTLLGLFAGYVIVSLGVLPLLSGVLNQFTSQELAFSVSYFSLGKIFLLSAATIFLLALPWLQKIRGIQASTLFQEAAVSRLRFERNDLLWFLPFVAGFAFLVLLTANSYRVAGLFGACVLACASLSLLFAMLFARLPEMGGALPWRLAMLKLRRGGGATSITFMTIALAALFSCLIPQLYASLKAEITPEQNPTSLFLFDIQEEQVSELKGLLKDRGVVLDSISPMVRSRILARNGEPFERLSTEANLTREEEEEKRFRNRGVNMSYRELLDSSEQIITGSYIFNRKEPYALSVEEGYAKRLGWELGDIIDLDVQGVAIKGVVQSLRKVRWASFKPNFFVLIEPGVLEGAPKTFLATLAQVGDKVSLQQKIVSNFPNISIVDVAEVLRRILLVSQKILWAFQFMALLSFIVGMSVLYSIAASEIFERSREFALEGSLGMSLGQQVFSLGLEFFTLSFLGALFGVIASTGLSLGLCVFVFQVDWVFSLWEPLAILVLVPLIGCGVGIGALYRIFRVPIARTLFG